MSNLSDKEKNALKFYIGDVSGCDSFYGDGKAYVVLNSLFFPDIRSEMLRAAEGKYLNPAIIEDIPRLMEFFEGLFSAFGKSQLKSSCTTYRVERMADFELCRALGRTISMTSTAMSGFLDAYRDRRGIALMKFNLAQGQHCINAAEMLDYYAKPEETEIIVPPFMAIEIAENSLSGEERRITDCDGNPPSVSVTVSTNGICGEFDGAISEIPCCKAGIRVYNALNEGKAPDIEDVAEYSEWKKVLLKRLYSIFKQFL